MRRSATAIHEEIHWSAGSPAQMHGPAVASIAVGKTVGVAPEANLYFIAEWHGGTKPRAAVETAVTTSGAENGTGRDFGKVIAPAALIETIRASNVTD